MPGVSGIITPIKFDITHRELARIYFGNGHELQLVAYSPDGGLAGFYEIVQNEAKTLTYKTYQFYPGYNTMNLLADRVGRHILLFVVNNQPSNAVIVDVFAQVPPAQVQPMPEAVQTSPHDSYIGQSSGSVQYLSYSQVPGSETRSGHGRHSGDHEGLRRLP